MRATPATSLQSDINVTPLIDAVGILRFAQDLGLASAPARS
jgi:hypothetical protein